MMYSTIKRSVTRIASAIIVCLGVLTARRPDRSATDTEGLGKEESSELGRVPERRRELDDGLEMLLFWFGLVFIALMLLLGLAIPAIIMLGAELLLIEHVTRYKASLAGKSCPA